MLQITRGNLLRADAEALVNTVNTVGVMGKGIALQFKQAYPENYRYYRRACNSGEVEPGRMLVFETGRMINPRYIVNFPTKRHWRNPSRIGDIRAGLEALRREVETRNIRSLAVPPLGCGNGGLEWSDVWGLIVEHLSDLRDVHVVVFEPAGAPDPKTMPVGTKRPRLTPARALLIKALDTYARLGYSRSLLEIQKLAYLLQEVGEPLRLRFETGRYGPYAHNLNKVLERLEGHYLRGYGDSQRPETQIDILDGAVEAADRTLADRPDTLRRLDRVARLIEGFETPYGLELLASIHWLRHHGETPIPDPATAREVLSAWTRRKAELFTSHHVEVAWKRLEEEGWLEVPS